MTLHEAFNRTVLSKFLNRPAGRVFRIVAGLGFFTAGVFRHDTLGLAAMLWGVFPLTAGAFDVCYISAALGGPFSGATIRKMFESRDQPVVRIWPPGPHATPTPRTR